MIFWSRQRPTLIHERERLLRQSRWHIVHGHYFFYDLFFLPLIGFKLWLGFGPPFFFLRLHNQKSVQIFLEVESIGQFRCFRIFQKSLLLGCEFIVLTMVCRLRLFRQCRGGFRVADGGCGVDWGGLQRLP